MKLWYMNCNVFLKCNQIGITSDFFLARKNFSYLPFFGFFYKFFVTNLQLIPTVVDWIAVYNFMFTDVTKKGRNDYFWDFCGRNSIISKKTDSITY